MLIHDRTCFEEKVHHNSHERYYNIVTVNRGPPIITQYCSVDISLALFLTAIFQVKIGHKLHGYIQDFHEGVPNVSQVNA